MVQRIHREEKPQSRPASLKANYPPYEHFSCVAHHFIPILGQADITSISEMPSSDPLDDVRPMFELRGRNYVITGGAQGIGFACTRAICEMGGNVAVLDIQDKPVDEFETLSTRFSTKTIYIRTDVTSEESIKVAIGRVVQELGSIDGCVPAAGIAIDKPFLDQTWEEFNRIQEINVSTADQVTGYSHD